MTKMAAMLIYGKNLKKNILLWNQKADNQIWSLMLLYRETVKQWNFSETIVVYDGKFGRCS